MAILESLAGAEVSETVAVDPVRLVIEEQEPGQRDENGSLAEVFTTVFVEVVELPAR